MSEGVVNMDCETPIQLPASLPKNVPEDDLVHR